MKIFCVGRNKTGTTSLAKLFKNLNIPVASQRPAELLFDDWKNHDFSRLTKMVKYGGVVFQDVPFSLPNTYQVLYEAYPSSKFILTVRDSPEEWYTSLTSYHSKVFNNGKLPDKQALQNANYVYKGWMWKMFSHIYKTPDHDLYNEKVLKNHYSDHNNEIIDFFSDKPGKLLVVNLKDEDAANRISRFLGLKKKIEKIPWENKT
ncbi:sulfotransferase [Ekhidna sp.]|uniref:sulfotransferase n=1 Tax=Ekhidna sp. TaxID=2608089 RepID=UPI003B5A29C7